VYLSCSVLRQAYESFSRRTGGPGGDVRLRPPIVRALVVEIVVVTFDPDPPAAKAGTSSCEPKSLGQQSRPIAVASVPHPNASSLYRGESASPCRSTEMLGELLSPFNRMDVL
jgi:hypothetical protein